MFPCRKLLMPTHVPSSLKSLKRIIIMIRIIHSRDTIYESEKFVVRYFVSNLNYSIFNLDERLSITQCIQI